MKKRYWPKDNVLRNSFHHWISTTQDNITDTTKYWDWLKSTYKVYYISGGDPGYYTRYEVAAEERDWTLFLLRWS